MSIPGFESAQRYFENQSPPFDDDECVDALCGECPACLGGRGGGGS